MRRSGIVIMAGAFLLAGTRPGLAQFTPEELGQRPFWEELLKTASVLRSEGIGEGVTKPYAVYLKHGDGEQKACWKNPSGVQDGFLEGWQYEIAAYRLDKLIGLNMIPPAVEREFQGKEGALVYWVENKHSLLKVVEQGIRIPDEAVERTEKAKWLARAWDSLIANDDRTQQNVLYTEDWRMILFDHSRAFRSDGEFTERLMFGRNGIKVSQQGTAFLFRRLPRWFLEKIKTLTFENVKAAVGTTLKDREITAILARKDILLKEIALMVREQGEAAVLY
jgi:hypothetical protein